MPRGKSCPPSRSSSSSSSPGPSLQPALPRCRVAAFLPFLCFLRSVICPSSRGWHWRPVQCSVGVFAGAGPNGSPPTLVRPLHIGRGNGDSFSNGHWSGSACQHLRHAGWFACALPRYKCIPLCTPSGGRGGGLSTHASGSMQASRLEPLACSPRCVSREKINRRKRIFRKRKKKRLNE